MTNIETYLNILTESLDKKSKILTNILELSKKQEEVINKEQLDIDIFEELMERKQKYINEIDIIDSGFATTFDRIKEHVTKHSHLYSREIEVLKQKITEVSEIGIAVQVVEEKNKNSMERYFAKNKNKVKTYKKSRKTVTSYYKNMNNTQKEQSYFLDQKK